jgi:hypothetical protein
MFDIYIYSTCNQYEEFQEGYPPDEAECVENTGQILG